MKQRRNARRTAVADSVLMNSRTQKILYRIAVILLSTDAAARLCARRALQRWYLKIQDLLFQMLCRSSTYLIQFRKYYLLLLLSPWASLGRNQSLVRRPVRCILGKFLGVVCHCFPPVQEIWTYEIESIFLNHAVYLNKSIQYFSSDPRCFVHEGSQLESRYILAL